MKTYQKFSCVAVLLACMWVLFSALLPTPQTLSKNKGVSITATGTGNTTGAVARVKITNPSPNEVTITLGPCLIISMGIYQGYIVPGNTTVTIAPGGSLATSLNGYCTNIHQPPVPNGAPLPAYHTWIKADELTFDPNRQPKTTNGWQPLPTGAKPDVLMPGTNRPITHTIDINKYPAEAAPIIFEAITRIETAYNELLNNRQIETPLSGNPTEQHNGVVQHTLWRFTAALTGSSYEVEDFSKNIIKQFEENTAQKYQTTSPTTRNEVDKGVLSLWNTFTLVGEKAKLFPEQEEQNPPTLITNETPKPTCHCGEITFKVEMNGKEFEVSSSKGEKQTLKHKFLDVKNDLTITNVKVNCPCSIGGGMCDFYPQNSNFDNGRKGKATIQSDTHNLTENNGVYSLAKQAGKPAKLLKLTIRAWCKGDTCEENKDCKKDFELTFERERAPRK